MNKHEDNKRHKNETHGNKAIFLYFKMQKGGQITINFLVRLNFSIQT